MQWGELCITAKVVVAAAPPGGDPKGALRRRAGLVAAPVEPGFQTKVERT
jgi:hypothetical protein